MKNLCVIVPLALVFCFAVGCQDKETMAKLEVQGEAPNLPGFIFSEPAPNRDEKIQILVDFDMEGLAGQDDWRTAFAIYEQYKKGQELLTADVNAVIGGLAAGGADEIYVLDSHGSGSRNPDIILEKMDSRAKLVSWSDIPEGTTLGEYYGIDAVVAVGDHSKTGGGGFMAHTRTLGMDFIINGRSVNETELLILDYGTDKDIPVIFVSGDDKLKEQLKPYPWIEYVTVKFATSASSADLRPVEEVHEEMRVAASKAVKKTQKSKAVKLKMPFTAGLRAVPPASLSILRRLPGINYQNETVTFEAEKYWDARNDGWAALVRIAVTGHDEVKEEKLWEILDSRKIGKEVMTTLYMRWLDYESGRWKPPDKK